MKLLSTLFILTAAQFSTAAFANSTHPEDLQSYHIECESCVTESQFTQAAKDNAIHKETVFINVMNIQNNGSRNKPGMTAMANAQCCFYCKPSVPVAIGYSVSEAFRTQVSSPSRAKPAL